MKTIINFAVILGILSGGIYYYAQQKTQAEEVIYPSLQNEITVHHPDWKGTLAPVANQDGRIIRKGTQDYATILELTPETIKISWDNWGIETFVKGTNGIYTLLKK